MSGVTFSFFGGSFQQFFFLLFQHRLQSNHPGPTTKRRGPEFKVGKDPCGPDCFQLLEEVKKIKTSDKDEDKDSTTMDAPGGKTKKHNSVDSGNEIR